MNSFEKFLGIFGKNLGYTIVLIIAIIFFAYFSDGLIPGIMTAISALVAYTCAVMLYKEIKKEFTATKATPVTTKKAAVKKKTSKKTNKK